MRIAIQTRGGLPAFTCDASPFSRVEVLEAAAALRAGLDKEDVRLSHSGKLLDSRDTLQSLGIRDGSEVLLHVRMGAHAEVPSRAAPASTRAPASASASASAARGLPVDGIHVSIILANGKQFYRPKVAADDDVSRLIDDAVSRVKQGPTGAPLPDGGRRAQLLFRGQPLRRGKSLREHGVGAGDELVLHLAPPGEPPAAAPAASKPSGKVCGGKTYGRTAGGVGAKKSASSSSSAVAAAGGKKKWTATSGGYKLVHVSGADARDDEFRVAIDADVQAAADLMYDTVHVEVTELRRTNRKLRARLRNALFEASDSESSCTEDGTDSDDSLSGGDRYGWTSSHRRRGRRRRRDGSASRERDRVLDVPHYAPGAAKAGATAGAKGAASKAAAQPQPQPRRGQGRCAQSRGQADGWRGAAGDLRVERAHVDGRRLRHL